MNLKKTISALLVMSASSLAQTITVNTNALQPSWPSSFGTGQGTPSSSYAFRVTGSSLSTAISVTVSDSNNWAISTDQSIWTNATTLPNNANNTPLWVRMTGSNIGTFTNTVTLTSTGASNRTVTSTGAVAQALAAVMYDKVTDTVVKPASAVWPGLVIPQVETWEGIANIWRATKVNSYSETSGGGVVNLSNGVIGINAVATNPVNVAAVRLHGFVNMIGPAGIGWRFQTNNVAWIKWDGNGGGTNFIHRFVMGMPAFALSNIGVFPVATDRAVAAELRYSTNAGGTHEARLRANNGTNQTNGPWVTLGNIYERILLGIEQRNDGSVRLWKGNQDVDPSILTTISNGPTTQDATADTSFEYRLETSGTNGLNPSIMIYDAEVHIIP